MQSTLRQQIINDILRILSIKSFTDTDGIQECQKAVMSIAQSLGFKTSLRGQGRVVVIEPKDAQSVPELGILTHLDTVPFEETEWSHNPLGELVGDRIYGRGVIDDKAAIILALYAFSILGNTIRPTWQILVGSSEEGEWLDMQAYLEEGHTLPEFSFTIDGDGIQNGCKGYMDLELKFKRNSSESRISELYVPNGVNNSVPELAIAIIDGKQVECKGIAVHSSIPETGKNALVELANTLKSQYHISEFSGFFKMMEILRETFDGCAIGFDSHPEILNDQYVGYTTVCPTTCSLDGDVISVNLNIRLCPGTTSEEVARATKTISSRFQCECKHGKFDLPAYVTKDSKAVQLLIKSYEYMMEKATVATIAKGIGYNATIPNCIIFGPRFAVEHDEPDTCHAVDESRKVDDLIKFFQMLVFFIQPYLS